MELCSLEVLEKMLRSFSFWATGTPSQPRNKKALKRWIQAGPSLASKHSFM